MPGLRRTIVFKQANNHPSFQMATPAITAKFQEYVDAGKVVPEPTQRVTEGVITTMTNRQTWGNKDDQTEFQNWFNTNWKALQIEYYSAYHRSTGIDNPYIVTDEEI